MHIKYARLNLQEAEAAIEEDNFPTALKKCRDSAISLVKAIKEAYPKETMEIDPVDLKRLEYLLKGLTDSKDQAERLTQNLMLILSGAPKMDPSRIHAESILSLTGTLFQAVHDLFAPSFPEI